MQKLTFILFLGLFFSPFFLFAQKEASYWFRGAPSEPNWKYKYGQGEFENVPDAVNFAKNANIAPQMATIADTNGNLLLYTDGYQYWDNTHNLFITALSSTANITNAISERMLMIVPHPSEPDWYYCFKSDVSTSGELGSIRYDLVDLKNKQLKERNKLIVDQVARSFAIMKSEDGFWLVALGKQQFKTYKFDKNGFNSNPLIHNIGLANHQDLLRSYQNETNYLQMKASPDSKHLSISVTHLKDKVFRLIFWKFNPNTGLFGPSYHHILDGNNIRTRAIEFGADSRTVFVMADSINQQGTVLATNLYEHKAVLEQITPSNMTWFKNFSHYTFSSAFLFNKNYYRRLLNYNLPAQAQVDISVLKKNNQLQLLPDGNLFFYEHRYTQPSLGGIRGVIGLGCKNETNKNPAILGLPVSLTQTLNPVAFPAYFFQGVYYLPQEMYEKAAGEDQTLCQIDNAKLGKSPSNPNFNYRWIKNENLLDNANSPTPTFLADRLTKTPKENEETEFILEISDKLSCAKGLDTVKIKFTNVQTPVILSNSDTTLCIEQKAKFWVQNKIPQATLQWYLNDKLVLQNRDSLSLDFMSVGKMQISVESTMPNCPDNKQKGIFNLNIKANPVAEIEGLAQKNFCEKGILQAKKQENAQYQWFRNQVSLNLTIPKITVNQNGSYHVVVSQGKCITVSKPVDVQILSKPPVQILKNTPEITFCKEGILKATKMENVDYQWFHKTKLIGEKTEITAKESGWYFLTVRQNTCITYDSVKVNIKDLPKAQVFTDNPKACEKTTLKAIEGESLVYQWFKNGEKMKEQGQNLEIKESGQYKVVLSRQECTDTSAAVQIDILPLPKAQILDKNAQNQIKICQIGTIETKKQSGEEYAWFFGTRNTWLSNEAQITTNKAGKYWLKATKNGCVAWDSVEVLIFERINAQIEQGTKVDFCQSGTLKAVPELRTSYIWQKKGTNLGNGQTLEVRESGNYTLIAQRDVCTDSTQIAVKIYQPADQALLRSEKEIFCPDEQIQLWIEKPQNAQYQWFKDGKMLEKNNREIQVGETGTYWAMTLTNGICEMQTNRLRLSHYPKPEVRLVATPKTLQPAIKLYPNPAPAFVRVELPAELKGTDKQLLIQSSGKIEVLEWRLEGKLLEEKSTVLANPIFGKYQVKVQTENACLIESAVFDFQEIATEKPQNIRIELWDNVGRKIWAENLPREKITPYLEIRTADLPQAVYWLKIVADQYQSSHKVVIE